MLGVTGGEINATVDRGVPNACEMRGGQNVVPSGGWWSFLLEKEAISLHGDG